MHSDPTRTNRINSFSLVSYIPDPLGSFLNGVRQDLAPGCTLRAHVTVLPPRPLLASVDAAWRQVRELAPAFPRFDVELTEVRSFTVSNVIYLDIGAGVDRLREMHAVLNTGLLEAPEVFEFCPHITLAQDLAPGEVSRQIEIARQRWAGYPQARSFRVDSLTLVQNTEGNNWIDLGQCQLGAGEIRLLEPINAC